MYESTASLMQGAAPLYKCEMSQDVLDGYTQHMSTTNGLSASRQFAELQVTLSDQTTIRLFDVHPCIPEFASEMALGGSIEFTLPSKTSAVIRYQRAGIVNSLAKFVEGSGESLFNNPSVSEFVDSNMANQVSDSTLYSFKKFLEFDAFGSRISVDRARILECDSVVEFAPIVHESPALHHAFKIHLIRQSIQMMNEQYDSSGKVDPAVIKTHLAQVLDLALCHLSALETPNGAI